MSEETKTNELSDEVLGLSEETPEVVEEVAAEGEEGGEEVVEEVERPQAVTLTPETLAALQQTLNVPQGQAEEPKMTPEQVRELLGQFDVDEQMVTALGLSEDAKGPMQKFKEAVVREAVRTMAVHQEHLRRQYDSQIAPLRQHLESQRMQELQRQFYSEHKDLAGLDQLVEVTYNQLAKSGTDFSKMQPKAAFKLVADETRKLKAKLGGGAQQKTNTAKQKPAVLSGGRTSGGSSKSSPEPSAQALVKELFG